MNFLKINISNLPEACQQPDILNLIALFQKVLDIVFLILPIALIVLITIDVIKIIISSDEKTSKTNTKTIITRTIFAVLLFFVPTIITVVMNVTGNSLGQNLSEFSTCMIAAESKDTRKEVKAIYDQKMEEYKERLKRETEAKKQSQNSEYEEMAQKMVTLAKSEYEKGIKGYEIKVDGETKTYCSKYGEELEQIFPSNDYNCMKWCVIFGTWLAKNTTSSNGTNLYDDIINKNGKVTYENKVNTSLIKLFDDEEHLEIYEGKKYGGTYTPKPGDYIFIDWDANGNWNGDLDTEPSEHLEIVTEYKNGKVYTLGGNTGDAPGKVNTHDFYENDAKIIYYGSWYNNQ